MKQKDFKVLTFKVRPNKSVTKILKQENEIFYIDIAAPPVDNQANEELIHFIAKEFSTKKGNIEFISGKNSTLKRVKIYF